MPAVALSIAGSDPSGGAGVQADLKTFHRHRVYGAAVVTLVTVQDTRAVGRVEVLGADLVAGQLDAVLADLPPAAIKTGALGSAAIVETVAALLAGVSAPLVVDPVMSATHGAELLASDARRVLVERLLPRATLVTPNLAEASLLSGRPVEREADMREAAKAIAGFGARAVLVTGGHLAGEAVDVCYADGAFERLVAPRVATHHTHGVGCALSASIAAWLARGVGLLEACGRAKRWVRQAITSAPGLGQGAGPIDHFATIPELE